MKEVSEYGSLDCNTLLDSTSSSHQLHISSQKPLVSCQYPHSFYEYVHPNYIQPLTITTTNPSLSLRSDGNAMVFLLTSLALLALASVCVQALGTAETTCTTDLLLNGFTVLHPTTTVYRSTTTLTSSLPCGSCLLKSQVHYPGGVVSIEKPAVLGVEGLLGNSIRITWPLLRRLLEPVRRMSVPAPSQSKTPSLPLPQPYSSIKQEGQDLSVVPIQQPVGKLSICRQALTRMRACLR